MSLKRILVSAVLVVASSSLADTGIVYLTTLPFVTGGCYFCAVSGSMFSAYDGYVGGRLDGVAFSNWISDEFGWQGVDSRSIGIPSGPINYTLTSFAGPGTDLSNTWADWVGNSQQFYNAILVEYEEAALLLGGDGTSKLPGFVNIDKSNGALVLAYQFALYGIFNPESTIAYWGFDPTVGGAATALLTQVQNDIANPLPRYSITYSQLKIYTPTSEQLCHQDFLYWCGTNAEFLQFVATPQPVPASLTPTVSTGSSQILTATFNAPGGYQMLGVVNVWINTALDGRQACYLAYSRPSNALYIVADNGDATQLSGKVMDGTGTVGNSQCTVPLAGSSATGSGNTFTLVLNLSFSASFAGNKVIYTAARDFDGDNSGWQTMGVHAVPPLPSTSPNPIGMSPSSGNTSSQIITFTYQDQSTASNLQSVWALVNTAIDGRAACYVTYYRPGNQLFLYPDNGDGTQATNIVLIGSNTISNSQCTVSAQGANVHSSGNTLTVSLPITFKTAFAGFKGVWLAAQTMGGAQTSPWQALGAEAVPGQ